MLSRRTLMAVAGSAIAYANFAPAATSGKTIDAHGHLTHHGRADSHETDRKIIEVYDKLGIDRGCCSILPP